MPVISKSEADAHDLVIEAAADLADLIESSGIEINEYNLEELAIFLAKNASTVRNILKNIKGRSK